MGFLPFDSLTGCSLRHCVFFGLDLKEFDFSSADLSGSFFDDCQLEKANFSGCQLADVSFPQNNLMGADFRGATNYLFSLEGNRVKGARFSLPEAVNLLSALGVIDGGYVDTWKERPFGGSFLCFFLRFYGHSQTIYKMILDFC